MSVILSRSELERMKQSVKDDLSPISNKKEQKRQELKQLSQDRQKNWPNTLEALRRKKGIHIFLYLL